jgi:hypothetical protein
MLKYFINIAVFLLFFTVYSQDKPVDTIKAKQRYGLRVGLDIFSPIYGLFDENRRGFELMADYRITNKFWLAGEWGFTDNFSNTDYTDFTTKGTYYKFGVDYNTYNNWPGMENMIFVGMRYGFSIFDQNIDQYIINNDPFLPPVIKEDPAVYKNLSALAGRDHRYKGRDVSEFLYGNAF